MDYETFEKLIVELQGAYERNTKLYQLGVDLSEHNEPMHRVASLLMLEAFGENGKSWIDWYLFDRVTHSGKILKAWRTKDGKEDEEICYDIKSLWEEVCNEPDKKRFE